MAQNPVPKKLLQEALDAITIHGTGHAAETVVGIPDATLRRRYRAAIKNGLTPSKNIKPNIEKENILLKAQLKQANANLAKQERNDAVAHDIRTKILQLTDTPPTPPSWLTVPKKKSSTLPGIPTLLCSDWHWAEVIRSEEIGGVPNQYNIRIANERAKTLIHKTIDLLTNHMVNPDYPGIHLFLGGDMFSGTLHDLSETNEVPMMKAFLDLYGVLVWCIEALAQTFPAVHVAGVVGNHGRTSFKPKTKDRTATNFDWLMYCMLEKNFESQKQITFNIPESTDVVVEIYKHKYLFTHGDQFRGGDGIIGPLGPIIRGDFKKRTRNMQIGLDYDTLVCGHFHRYISTRQNIVNGSLCGYNEYAFLGNFPYEPPIQALWITHPDHGITFQMPVYV